MTNEEAINTINSLKQYYNDKNEDSYVGFDNEDNEALDMAIQALEQQPCEDAISREAVNKAINKWLSSPYYDYKNYIYEMTKTIHELPSVTPQPKIGHWIVDVDRWGDIVTTVNGYRCSECNAFNTDRDNYCPNCGAKMEEVEDGK